MNDDLERSVTQEIDEVRTEFGRATNRKPRAWFVLRDEGGDQICFTRQGWYEAMAMINDYFFSLDEGGTMKSISVVSAALAAAEAAVAASTAPMVVLPVAEEPPVATWRCLECGEDFPMGTRHGHEIDPDAKHFSVIFQGLMVRK